MKLTLTFFHRLSLLNQLPTIGGAKQMRAIRDIRKKIDISQEEFKKYNYKEERIPGENGQPDKINSTWSNLNENKLVYDFTDMEIEEIKNYLTQLSEQNQITNDWLDLCDLLEVN
jgi:hypothetical protein